MGYQATVRAVAAAERRQQRDSKKRQRELERQAKERTKLSALEQARLEVDTFENNLEVLLSVHKDQTDPMDWMGILASLPPAPPRKQSHHELKVRRRLAVSPGWQNASAAIQQAQQKDEQEYQEALQKHADERAGWEKLSSLARRVLAGEREAYIEAINDICPFAELANIGSSLHFKVHNARIIECTLDTNGRKAIPSEVKSLTASGKVTAKPMPKARFVEIYQDYICGCVLRVAREIFGLLPVDTLLISAAAESLDTCTGQMLNRTFLSVALRRDILQTLNFEMLDPSDSILSFTHRGDLKASRKTGDFEVVAPLILADLPQGFHERTDFDGLLASAQRMRAELTAQCAALNPQSEDSTTTNGDL
jgi:hypothetical protein